MRLESVKQESMIEYPTISDISNNKKLKKGSILLSSLTIYPVAVPSYNDYVAVPRHDCIIANYALISTTALSVVFMILVIINKIKIGKSNNENEKIKRKKKLKLYSILLIVSIILSIMLKHILKWVI